MKKASRSFASSEEEQEEFMKASKDERITLKALPFVADGFDRRRAVTIESEGLQVECSFIGLKWKKTLPFCADSGGCFMLDLSSRWLIFLGGNQILIFFLLVLLRLNPWLRMVEDPQILDNGVNNIFHC